LVDSIALNSAGYTVVSGNPVIPHIQENFKLALYPDQAAADSNTGNIWIIDNIIFSDFGGGELTGISNGTARTSATNVGQVQDGTLTDLGITGGAADTYELVPSVPITAYVSTQEFTVKIHTTNLTTTPYLQISAIALPNTNAIIKKLDGSKAEIALAVGDLIANGIYKFKRNSANDSWILLTKSIATQTEVNVGTDDTKIVTPLKLATKGYLLKSVQTFTASGDWTKPDNIRAVRVKLVGAGGGGGNGNGGTGGTGGTTSFGSHCTATGGVGGIGVNGQSGVGGAAGIGSNGDLNLTGTGGGNGSRSSSSGGSGQGGSSFYGGGAASIGGTLNGVGNNGANGGGGGGGYSATNSNGAGGGGGGGYSEEFITSGLGATETVTIGAAGASSGSGVADGGVGGAGLVIVYEYT